MTEKEIFTHLFKIASRSDDTDGVVTCCLVRDEEIIADAVSANVIHAEYALLEWMNENGMTFEPDDIVYVTLQPCDRRTPGRGGEVFGDCTTNLINARAKNVVYAATYPKSEDSTKRFVEAGVSILQVADPDIRREAVELFNSTNSDTTKHIPLS